MKKDLTIKIIKISFSLILMLFFAPQTFASKMILTPTDKQVGLNEQFYLDLMLDSEGTSINGLEGSVVFPEEYLSLVRVEEAKSMINLWVQSPTLVGNAVKFVGIIPNGFDGVIDPFNQSRKLPGLIVRLVFESIKPGLVGVITPQFLVSLNDGLGTTQNVPATGASVNISDKQNQTTYENKDQSLPSLEASVIKNPDLLNNKFALIFKATDKESGIKEVLIKEGRREWKPITSPYLLKDQMRRSIIILQAVNHNDLRVFVKIEPIQYKFSVTDIILLIVSTILLIVALKYIYVKKNKK